MPITIFVVGIIAKYSQKYFKRQQDYLGHVNGQVEEVYSGYLIVKAFNGQDKALKEFKKQNDELYHSGWKSQFLSGLMHPLMNFIGNVGYVAVAILGGYFAIQGKITVGNIQSFIQYNKQFTQPIAQIAQISGMLQAMVASAERVFEFLEEPEEIETAKGNINENNLKGNVVFDHVNFGYDPEKTIINDFCANIKDGQKIAIVGPTGAGKTTMVKLLMRFYDTNSGSILIDGHNIKDFERGKLRKLFGMVLQDTWLFSGSVEDNIKYGNENATDSEVIEAAKAAHVHHFIKTLPDKALKEFKKQNDELYHSGWKSQFLSGLMHPLMNFIGNVGYVAVAILGGYFAIQGNITVGNIQSFIQYNKQFTQPIAQIAQISGMLQAMVASAERVFEFLEEPEETKDVENSISTEGLKGNVTFDHVHFGYDEDKTIINDFSATVKDGQKIAIVGPTGAGKTTMVKLLMRFYDVNQGAIYVDGHNIKEFNRGDLRKMFGMVLQDTWLFGGSIKDNIRYGKPEATDNEVIEAAKAAHVHHFIKTLPNSYDMVLNEETSNVSAGQKQLLTIARVILADPKILILDEATSSIDTRTEIQIQSAMDNLMKGRTSFIIAHRLSTIKNADLILVMNHGDIIEQGTHEELLAKNGFYADLYNSQFEECEE